MLFSLRRSNICHKATFWLKKKWADAFYCQLRCEMLFYVPQELFHRQSLCQTATERPLWPDLQHAVLQLCHEERCGTLWICAELQVSPDAGFLILICPPPPPFQSGCIRPALAWVYMMWQDRATSGSWSVPSFFFLSGEFCAQTAGWLLWLDCRIWRTTSWSWSPLCLSWTAWRSPSTPSTSALLFASSFSSWTRFEQVSQNLRAKCRPRDEVTISACVIPVFVFRKD